MCRIQAFLRGGSHLGLLLLCVCSLACSSGDLGAEQEAFADAATAPGCVDSDGDGYGTGCSQGGDCDDSSAAIHPGAIERCNGSDDNCDGAVDEGVLNNCGTCEPSCQAGQVEQCTAAGEVAADEDQDGSIDEGCACEPDTTQACCGTGIQLCSGDAGDEFGGAWGVCEGGAQSEEICGDGIDQDCDGVDEVCPDVQVACGSSPHKTSQFTLHFPGNGPTCPWGQGDNDSYIAGHHSARIEQVQTMGLPQNAVLCDLTFDVPQTGMYYDDVFILAFNEAVMLANAYLDVPGLFQNEGGLFLYDWDDVHGQSFGGADYCLGGGGCALPDSQADGSLELALGATAIFALAQRALELHRFDFQVIIIGDNDPTKDCAYSAFDLIVDVEYVEL